METPLVSICSITYNHAPFIRQCLDGFLMQKTNFPIEIIINDDCSTDGTTEIIREYAEKYPDKIFPIFHEQNLYSQGVRGIFQKFVFPKVRGKYIALCEGDDYWIDPNKLQKQVDFLEANPDYSVSFHSVRIVNSDESQVIGHHPLNLKRTTLELKDFKKCNYIQTNSVLYRWRFGDGKERLEDLVWEGVIPQDWMMHMLHAQKGKVHYDPTVMSIYRRHAGGIWINSGISEEFYTSHGYGHCLFYKNAMALFGWDWSEPFTRMLNKTIMACLVTGKGDILVKLKERFPEEYAAAVYPYSIKAQQEKAGDSNNVSEKNSQTSTAAQQKDVPSAVVSDKRKLFAMRYSDLILKHKFIYRLSRIISELSKLVCK